jgi:hypothetical protein
MHKYEKIKNICLNLKNNIISKRSDCNKLLARNHLWDSYSDDIKTIEMIFETSINPSENNNVYIYQLLKHICFNDQNIMNYEEFRLKSFRDWPKSKDFINVNNLAFNGFSFMDVLDCVQCNFCEAQIYDWEAGDSTAHEEYTPMCPFARGEQTKNIRLTIRLTQTHSG